MLSSIATAERLGQWQRWFVYVELRARTTRVQRVGSVYADSFGQAKRLAKRAAKAVAHDVGYKARLAHLRVYALAPWEYEAWLRWAVSGRAAQNVGPLVDGSGSPVASFVPTGL